MICVMRWNPACAPVVPKLALPIGFRPFNERTLTRFNRFSISILMPADFEPRRKFLVNTPSTLNWPGDRASVIVRGALPNVLLAAGVNAAVLIHEAVGWSAEARRSS